MPATGERRATVLGRGIAALTCARRLREGGWSVALPGPPARAVPVLLLGAPTVELLAAVWGPLRLSGHALRARRVRWGGGAGVERPEPGLVVDGALLVRELERRTEGPGDDAQRGDGWIVHAEGRASVLATRALGRRVVLHATAALRPGTDDGVSCMETVDGGWLFLLPTGGGDAVLQAMMPAPPADPGRTLRRMVGAARDVARRVADLAEHDVRVLPAAPTAGEPIASPRHVAVGEAARAFDPLAGDGTGMAVRGAILAAAVLESVAAGLESPVALGHYDHRVRLAFLHHLHHCLRYYGQAFEASAEWRTELAPLRAELAHPANRALAARPFTHRLEGRRLAPIA